ncbi:hypothetical protein L228DRAFT_245047 [Xylona heveae TC161]|uniref:TMEM205-like domain-containing protein n=1 Tax=Xylona heveae (strain CBS 132557 / TC161) TaxID=1328760 RepID=A0A165HZZ7_XYLHT|nr:hypothetical protein L228DRAFT_245047 [Xylona heveae TC161]KZF24159.1 hypothetical protein L228DRAFT_245047 [Xylona heveae TC161]
MSSFTSPAPYHILSYGTLLGTSVFQSFVGGIVAFKVLPRPQFSTLQRHTFPIYFSMQTVLPVILALTYPGERSLLDPSVTSGSSLSGVLAEQNRIGVLAPLATMFVTGLVNLVFLMPRAHQTMRERAHQGTIDGKQSYDKGPHSPRMTQLNKRFGKIHGASTLLNLAGLVATVCYGFTLSGRLY